MIVDVIKCHLLSFLLTEINNVDILVVMIQLRKHHLQTFLVGHVNNKGHYLTLPVPFIYVKHQQFIRRSGTIRCNLDSSYGNVTTIRKYQCRLGYRFISCYMYTLEYQIKYNLNYINAHHYVSPGKTNIRLVINKSFK